MPAAITLPAASRAALQRSLGQYSEALGQDILAKATKKLLDGITEILNPEQVEREGTLVTQGKNEAQVRGELTELLKDFQDPQAIAAALNLDFKLDTARDVASGAGRFVQANADPELVDLYPALELRRFDDREVPRGMMRGPKGTVIEAPGQDWPSRWEAAAAESGDDDAATVLQDTGRMVALKSSGIWQALGDGAGGYDDTLGNPFAPFAFNSGYDTEDVSRAEAVELGLIEKDEQADGAEIDFEKLFDLPLEVAA
jgi:hypothetical protein